jgi:hypothetical protein
MSSPQEILDNHYPNRPVRIARADIQPDIPAPLYFIVLPTLLPFELSITSMVDSLESRRLKAQQ